MLQDTAVDLIDQQVVNPDLWYPSPLNIKDWQELYRVPGVTPKTLERQMLLAMGDINGRMAKWKADQVLAGVAALPAANGTDYREAVYAQAMGLLVPLLPSLMVNSKLTYEVQGKELLPAEWLARAADRVSRIMRVPGTGGSGKLSIDLI